MVKFEKKKTLRGYVEIWYRVFQVKGAVMQWPKGTRSSTVTNEEEGSSQNSELKRPCVISLVLFLVVTSVASILRTGSH